MSSGDTSETGNAAGTSSKEHKAEVDKAVQKALDSKTGKK